MCIYKHSRFEVSKSEKKTTFVHFENENVFFFSFFSVLKERKKKKFYLRTENGR